MTWCPSTLHAKAEGKARAEAAEPVVDLGDATRVTHGRGPLPPRVATLSERGAGEKQWSGEET